MGDVYAGSSEGRDQTDAGGNESNGLPFHTVGPAAPLAENYSTHQNALHLQPYNGGPVRRGMCIIFNNKVFEPHTRLNERTGTDADETSLEDCFERFGFYVEKYRDRTGNQIKEKLKELSEYDYSGHDCFVCCFLTHGTEEDYICASDGVKVPVDEITKHFRGDKCESLLGKPKLFFLQACRGTKAIRGVPLDKTDATGSGLRIPTHADFLVAYSTVPGFLSWRNMDTGSWFIQTLCSVLREMAGSTDILHMLTVVGKRVALMPEVQVWKKDGDSILAKQMPTFMSTLTDLVFFTTGSRA